jgi:hypothetical protein
MRRSQVIKYIESLDPVKDHLEIVRLTTQFEFPKQTERALEFALFRTFAVPSIGDLLDNTREFAERPQKRYDDTDLILSEVLEYGYDSPRGLDAIRRMNTIHKRFGISNHDYVYVLSTFVVEPGRWLDRYGYRKTSEHEKIAAFTYWQEVGKRMGIKDIPPNYEQLEQLNIDYERDNFIYHEGSRRVADATINLFLSWLLPKSLYGLGRPFVIAAMDAPLQKAFGYNKPNAIISWCTKSVLTLDGFFQRLKPLPKQPILRTKLPRTSYPNGYNLADLGPKPDSPVAESYLRHR